MKISNQLKKNWSMVFQSAAALLILFSGPAIFMSFMTALALGKVLTLFCILPVSTAVTLAYAKLSGSSFKDELLRVSLMIGFSIVRYAPPLFVKLTMMLAATQAFTLLGAAAVPVAIFLGVGAIIAALCVFGLGSERGISLIKTMFHRCFHKTGEEASHAPANENQAASSSATITRSLHGRSRWVSREAMLASFHEAAIHGNSSLWKEAPTQTSDDIPVLPSQTPSANDEQAEISATDSIVLRS